MDKETLGIDTEREKSAGEIKKSCFAHTEQLETTLKTKIRLSANFGKRYVLHTEQHSFFGQPILDGHLHDGKRWHRL